ncbi:MAG: hypothetical protein P4L42_14845 [Desulfocapsaceae bacterium]|nr:hypothetical protein [Desulfocapsaceae bacterium]
MNQIPFISQQWNHYHPFCLHTECKSIQIPGEAALAAKLNGATKKSRSQARIVCDLPVATPTLPRRPVAVSRGLDFLKVSFWLEWKTDVFFTVLDEAKKRAQDYDMDSIPVCKERGYDWNLHRSGTSKYSFRLTSGDVTLMFNKRKSDGKIPTCRLEIGSLSCWTPGFHSIYDQIKVFFDWYGAKIAKERVSEVHLASDFVGTDIKNLDIDNQNKWVAKSVNFNPWSEIPVTKDANTDEIESILAEYEALGVENETIESKNETIDFSSRYTHRKFTSCTIGSRSGMVLNIYDKVTELKTTHSAHKQEIFAEIWGLEKFNDLPVTRVEYRIRRPNLREFADISKEKKIDTVADLVLSLASLWQYLTMSWTKHTKKDVDRNHHQSRAEASEFWEKVRAVVWTGVFGLIRSKPVTHKDMMTLRKQARGIAMSIAAFHDVRSNDIDKIIYIVQQLIEEDLYEFFDDQEAFIKKMKKKRNEINCTMAG